ncbi:Glyco_hydro_79C domain-containing protein [Ktedonobacteria bacterium brp13]|nr:Glyco_hydro_79C domain-containing protein [Ktedonobacteria bacterium brp13]
MSYPNTARLNNIAQITISQQPGAALMPNLIGFSIEISQLCPMLKLAQTNTSYVQYYKNLGRSILRIGGNSVDSSIWVPQGQKSCALNPNNSQQRTIITRQVVEQLFTFARKIHWQVIWGLNLAENDPTSTADEAAWVARLGGSNLFGFTIGNEPELYAQRGLRPSWWDEQHFQYEWSRYITSIRHRVKAKFVGPEACCTTPLFKHFLENEAPETIGISSHHLYAISNTITGNAPPTIPLLLSATTLQEEELLLDQWSDEASAADISLALTEVNSASGGGVTGVSNTMAAALWADDLLFQAATRSIIGVDFHNTAGAFYDAFSVDGQVTPLYYGLLLFHYATSQTRWLQSSIHYVNQQPLNISAYALIHADGSSSVFVINKELTQSTTIRLTVMPDNQVTHTYTHATIISLAASSISATSGVTLGNRTISAAGTWTPHMAPIPISHNTASLTINAGSAALITLS